MRLDPDFAEAYAALAQAHIDLGTTGFNLRYRGQFPRARKAAQRALEIDDRLGTAHAALGSVHLWYEWDFARARRAYERAVQVSPNDPDALETYALHLLYVEGRAKRARGARSSRAPARTPVETGRRSSD